ncbi:MAG: GtrA family protein [Chloroflexota bacterium]
MAKPKRAASFVDWILKVAERFHVSPTMVKFVLVGGIGFLINEAILFLLYDAGVGFFLPGKHHLDLGLFSVSDARLLFASICAVEFAIVCQFNMHERWTFRHRNREGNILWRFGKYNVISAVSPIITVVFVNVLTPELRDAAGDGSILAKTAPYIANGLGVAVGFTWNYLFNSRVIWRRHAPTLDDV